MLLHRQDGQKLEVEDISLEGIQGVQLTTRTVEEAEPEGALAGDIWLEAHYSGERAGSLAGRGVVQLKTNHRQFPRLEIPLTVHIRQMVESHPKRVWIQAGSEAVKPVEAQVILSHSKGLPVQISSIEASPEGLSVTPMALEGRPSALRLIIGYVRQSNSVTESREGVIRVEIETDSDGMAPAPLDIPVTIMPSHARVSQPQKATEPPPEGSGS